MAHVQACRFGKNLWDREELMERYDKDLWSEVYFLFV